MKKRGFDQLVGQTITKIDAGAINDVLIYCNSGLIFDINAEENHIGIPVISCYEQTQEKQA